MTGLTWRWSDWHPMGLLALLATLAVAGDWLAIEAKGIHLSAGGVSLVLAICFLGAGPATAIALLLIGVAAVRATPPFPLLLNNIATFAVFPATAGLAARWVTEQGWVGNDWALALMVFAVYWVVILTSVALISTFRTLYLGQSLRGQITTVLRPTLPSEAAAAMLVLAYALAYRTSGLVAL